MYYRHVYYTTGVNNSENGHLLFLDKNIIQSYPYMTKITGQQIIKKVILKDYLIGINISMYEYKFSQ